jgi:hypothetical protein
MRATPPEFSDRILTQLLQALHARTTGHPDNPGLIASWPDVPEDRMAAACAELHRRGHPVFRVYVEGRQAGPEARNLGDRRRDRRTGERAVTAAGRSPASRSEFCDVATARDPATRERASGVRADERRFARRDCSSDDVWSSTRTSSRSTPASVTAARSRACPGRSRGCTGWRWRTRRTYDVRARPPGECR